MGANGQLTTSAEGKLDAQGRYTLDLASTSGTFVIQALDASGKVLAATVLEAAAEGETTAATPMDSESSLEVSVYLQALADKGSSETVNAVDLRARINANMAVAAQQGSASADAFQARVKALADAVRAAQQTEVNAYAKAGVTTSQSSLFQAEVSAAASLNAALDKGDPAQAAYEKFYADLRVAAEKQGAKAEQEAESERAASASFQATVRVRLPSADARPLVDAAVRGSATLEARASGATLSALLAAANATDSVKAQAATASTTLATQVSASASAAATAEAFAAFNTSVAGSGNIQASVLGQYLGVSLATQLAVSQALQVKATASATLTTAVNAAVSAAVTANSVNVTALATGIAEAYQAYGKAVRATASTTLIAFGPQATPATEIILVADGSFRLGQ